MAQARKILMAGATFMAAMGIGFVMQNGDALAERFGANATEPVAAAQQLASAPASSLIVTRGPAAEVEPLVGPIMPAPQIDDISFAVRLPEAAALPKITEAPVLLAAASADGLEGLMLPGLAPAATPIDCAPTMEAAAAPGAMAALTLTAPCHPSQSLVLHHQGMMFSAMTDESGSAKIDVPVLSESAVFIAAFADGEGAATTLIMPEVAALDRAVLLWQGDSGLQIHAREFGAEYGDAGHVWHGAPRDIADGEGFIVALGDGSGPDVFRAEVYTFPGGAAAEGGQVTLTVEAEITKGNCGREVAAQSIQIGPDAAPIATDLTLTMPPCETVGDFLVFNSMFNDLMIAAR